MKMYTEVDSDRGIEGEHSIPCLNPNLSTDTHLIILLLKYIWSVDAAMTAGMKKAGAGLGLCNL